MLKLLRWPRSRSETSKQEPWTFVPDPISAISTSRSQPPQIHQHTSLLVGEASLWDDKTFSPHAHLLPAEQNGDWKSNTVNAFKHPGDTASAVTDALISPTSYNRIASSADEAKGGLKDRINRAFQGRDVPAMHSKVVSLIPSVSMPSMRQINQSFDSLTDAAQSLVQRCSSTGELGEPLPNDHFAFARQMGAKARGALVDQNVCEKWQVLPSRDNVMWQARLDGALIEFFDANKQNFTGVQLFSMTPVWKANADKKVWLLELDTGWTDLVVDSDTDDFEERPITLLVHFELRNSDGYFKNPAMA